MALPRSALGVAISLCVAPNTQVSAQTPPRPHDDVNALAVLGGNLLVGGLTAGIHALIGGRNLERAFARGSFGGVITFGGKLIASESAAAGPVLFGHTVASAGNSITANAGRGERLLDQLTLPFGPLRFRVSPYRDDKFALAINAGEVLIAVGALTDSRLELDWSSTLSRGAFVFLAPGRLIETGRGQTTVGSASPSGIILSSLAEQPDRVLVHESIHVMQFGFFQETIARPFETWLRRSLPGGRHIPSWLELGFVAPAYWVAEQWILGDRGTHAARQAEATWFENRR